MLSRGVVLDRVRAIVLVAGVFGAVVVGVCGVGVVGVVGVVGMIGKRIAGGRSQLASL